MADMAVGTYFLDTSALLPRYLRGAPGHAWIDALCALERQSVVALAEITAAELAAALNQLVRGGVLRRTRCETALALFWDQVARGEYAIVPVSSAIVRHAADLCGQHALKGYDAVQLACALAFREDVRHAALAVPNGSLADPTFITEDKRLGEAASAQGFAIDTPLAHPPSP